MAGNLARTPEANSWLYLKPVVANSRRAEFVEADQADSTCPAPFAKIFLFLSDPNHRLIPCRPVPPEGRLAIVTDAGRDAVDVEVLLTSGTDADGQVVWS
jgi:hypothetical protein